MASRAGLNLVPATAYPGLAATAAALAALPAIFGFAVYVNPQLALQSLQIPVPDNYNDRKRLHGMIKISSAREMAFGVTTVGIWYFARESWSPSAYSALGLAMLAKGCMKFSDGIVQRNLVGTGEAMHFMFVPFNFGVGFALLGLI